MTEKKMSKKEVDEENERLKEQLQTMTSEAQRISTAAQQIQAQSAQRLMTIRLLEGVVNSVNGSLLALQRDVQEILPQSTEQEESEG